ncbi:MAG: YtxH domain-containing protein [Calditrichaceae bacterium]
MSSNESKFLKGFLLGGAFGMIAGVLFAPKSGKDTRDDLKHESDDLLEKAQSELDKIKNELNDLKDKISDTIKKGKAKLEQSETIEERDFDSEVNSIDEDQEEEKAPSKTTKKTKK